MMSLQGLSFFCQSTRVAVQVKTVTQAGSEDLALVVVERDCDGWTAGAKTALAVAHSAPGFRAGVARQNKA
jgi:hypothetical protein